MRHKMLKNVTKSIIISDFPCLKHYFPCRDKPKWKDDKWNNNNKTTTTTTTSFFINFYHSMLTTISVFFNKAWNYSNKRNANINIHHKVDLRAFFAGRFINTWQMDWWMDGPTEGWMDQCILIDFNWPQLTVIDINLPVLTIFDEATDKKKSFL